MEITPGQFGGTMITHQNFPDIHDVLTPAHQLYRGQLQPFLVDVGGVTGEPANGFAADLGEVADVGGETEQLAVDETP